MKKKYVKPTLYYECFTLSQSIAVCGYDMNLTESQLCQAIGDPDHGMEGIVILGAWCDMDVLEDGVDGIICYQNGTTTDPMFRVFNS